MEPGKGIARIRQDWAEAKRQHELDMAEVKRQHELDMAEVKSLRDGEGQAQRQHELDMALLKCQSEERVAAAEQVTQRFEAKCWTVGWCVLFLCAALILLALSLL